MILADLHLHGRFSRATSKQLTLPNLEKYAKLKGLHLLGTGDFMHPEWIKELKQELQSDSTGIYRRKSGFPFVLQNEISLMYSQGGKGRRVHVILLAPSFEIVDQITEYFKKFGRVDYDGRPIFNKSVIEITEGLKQISDKIEIIPAHIWTPWFGLLGSKSGFDSFKEAFGDQAKHIYALETGLSSDPPMNWRVSALDNLTILSFSDSHSFWPWRIGREATLLDLKKLTYDALIKAIRTREGYAGTIEVDPNYGKYHFDGHRICNVCLSPLDSAKLKGICPKCKRPLVIGVQARVEELADRPEGYALKGAPDFKTLLPLHELIAAIFKCGVATQKTWAEYNKLIDKFGSEYAILLNTPEVDLLKATKPTIARAIMLNRAQKIKVTPGYDGVYGVPVLETTQVDSEPSEELAAPKASNQKSLVDFSS